MGYSFIENKAFQSCVRNQMRQADQEPYQIFIDGSFISKTKIGAWAARIQKGSTQPYYIYGRLNNPPNNQYMEIVAAVFALNDIENGYSGNIRIYSDSKDVVDYINGSFAPATKKKHLAWALLEDFTSRFPKLKSTWVKGHSGNKYHNEADNLARKAARRAI